MGEEDRTNTRCPVSRRSRALGLEGSVINGAMLSAAPPCQDFEAVGSH